MKKKGMFFSLVAILILLVIIINFKITADRKLEENKIASTQLRIKLLNDFVNSLELHYFENMIKVSSQTALDALSQYRIAGKQLNQLNSDTTAGDFETVMLFGYIKDDSGLTCGQTICGDYGSKLTEAQIQTLSENKYTKIDDYLTLPVMREYSFFDLLKKIETILENLEVNIDSFNIKIDNLKQTDNWNILVKATIDYHFSDKYNIAAWRGRTEKEISVNIHGLKDPQSGNLIDKTWKEDIGDGILVYNYPSFLNRLQPLVSDDTKGICQSDENCDIT